MRMQSSGLQLGRAGEIAFVLTVAAGFLSALFVRPFPFTAGEVAALGALGAVFTALGTLGLRPLDRFDSVPLWLAYFLVQIALATAIVILGSFTGGFWIISLPLVSQAVVALPRPWAALIIALAIGFGFTLPLALLSGWQAAAQNSIFFLVGVFFVIVFTQIAVSERRSRDEVERLAGELTQANEQLRGYAVQAEELATARERNRLAREVHDSLGHYLTVVNVQLEAARALLESEPARALEPLRKAQELTREGLADVRRSVAALRASPLEDRPLAEAIDRLVEACRAEGLLATLAVRGEVRPLPPQAELALFRAAQEGLTNVRKHSRASRCDIALTYAPERVRLSIADNGVGAVESAQGFGLVGVRERVELLGGSLHAETARGQGFRLEVEVPA